MSLGKKDLRAIRRVITDILDAQPGYLERERLVSAIDRELKPKKFVRASRVRRAEKAKGRKAEMAELRAAVFARDEHVCVICGEPATELEHVFGRKSVVQASRNCVAVCTDCHRNRHAARPSAAHWWRAYADVFGELGFSYEKNLATLHASRQDGKFPSQGRAGEAE